jgi:DnaJ-class molecular chaperone
MKPDCRVLPLLRCSACEGTGAFDLWDAEPCRRCNGTGEDAEEGDLPSKPEAARQADRRFSPAMAARTAQ